MISGISFPSDVAINQFKYAVDYNGASSPRTQVDFFPDLPDFPHNLQIGDTVEVYAGETLLHSATITLNLAFLARAETASTGIRSTPTKYVVMRGAATIYDQSVEEPAYNLFAATDNGNLYLRTFFKN